MAIDDQTGQQGGTAAQGNPSTGAPAAGTGTATTTGTTGTATGTTPQGTTGQTAPAPTGHTYREDRSQWIPPHRLREESTRRQTIETELQTVRQQLQALTGATPQTPADQKSEQVKAAFLQMFPQFKHFVSMSDEQIQQLVQTPQAVSRSAEAEQREWARHGKQQMSSLFTQVADALGAEELTADQQSDLKESFGSWLKRTCLKEQRENDNYSATLERYHEGDPKLLQEFVTRYTSNWVEPARRKATQQQLTRTRPVPQSGGRTQVTSVQRPATFKSLDERLDYAANLAKERGVTFGR